MNKLLALILVGVTGVLAPATAADVVWPAPLAPAYRDFAAKCAAGTATRGDLIGLKRFIAASAVDAATKTNLVREARRAYQSRAKRGEGEMR